MDNDGLKAPGDQVGGEQVKNSDEAELEDALKDLRYELCLKYQIDASWVVSQALPIKGEME